MLSLCFTFPQKKKHIQRLLSQFGQTFDQNSVSDTFIKEKTLNAAVIQLYFRIHLYGIT